MSLRLVEKIRAIEQRHAQRGGDVIRRNPGGIQSTGWPAVDAAIGGGLACGGLHEWLGLAPCSSHSEVAQRTREAWRPPVGVLIHLAWRVLDTDAGGLWSVWIGRRCFPYPGALLRREGSDRLLLERSLFVSPRQPADRLWAIDLALRSPAVGVLIADGGEFDMAATRRIQLLAKNHGVLALLVRPPWEQAELSAAQTRWLVRQESAGEPWTSVRAESPRRLKPAAQKVKHSASRLGATDLANPTWSIELLRCKGVHWEQAQDFWNLEWDRAACTLHLSTALGNPAGAAQAPPVNAGRGGRLSRRLA